jgi:hypothetical protein
VSLCLAPRWPLVVALWLIVGLLSPVRAQQPAAGSVELAPFTGGQFASVTFEDPDKPGGSVSAKSLMFGADFVFYPHRHVGAGALVVRQAVSLGLTGKESEQSSTLAGALVKFRLPSGRRTSLAIVSAGGWAGSRLASAQTDTTSQTSGAFFLAGAEVSVFTGRSTAVDIGVRGVLDRFHLGTDRPATYESGVMVVFGFALWAP